MNDCIPDPCVKLTTIQCITAIQLKTHTVNNGLSLNKRQGFLMITAPQGVTDLKQIPPIISVGITQPTTTVCVTSESRCRLCCLCQMAYITEIGLSVGCGTWTGVAPSSCAEVDLEVIEEYLQEHSLEVQPAHTPASPPSTMMQPQHLHSLQGMRIIGQCVVC